MRPNNEQIRCRMRTGTPIRMHGAFSATAEPLVCLLVCVDSLAVWPSLRPMSAVSIGSHTGRYNVPIVVNGVNVSLCVVGLSQPHLVLSPCI